MARGGLRPLERLLWQRVPGYDSDAEEDEREGEEGEEGEGERDGDAQAAAAPERRDSNPHSAPDPELLERVRANLGGRWNDAPLVDFEPLHAGKSGVAVPLASKWTGSISGVMPTFRIDKINAPLVRDILLFNGLRPTGGTGFLVQWSGPRMNQALYQELHEFQRVNHFPGSTELTQKDRLWRHFHRMTQTWQGAFDFVPESFVLPAQTQEFKECFRTSQDIWIVKPHASSQGKGIYLLRDLDTLPEKDLSVVSKYVSNPLLIQGLKFDLRIYVLVTSFDPLRAYIYREGLTRFASAPYSTEDEHLGDAYRHLTNYSINKKAQNFKENQKLESDNYGHKWSLSALNRHLECVGVDVNLMWTRIMDLIVKTLLSVQPVISAKVKEAKVHPQCCFELYGFDVLVDEDLKPWLLEVNLSPSMAADSPLDKQIKSSLLCDTFNLVGLRRASARTVTESRLMSQLLSLRSSKALRSKGRGAEQAEEGSGEAPGVDAAALPGAIDQLSDQDLKMLAFSLEEQHRCHNFIHLYPTRPAMEFYAPLSGRCLLADEARRAWLLAAVMCGAERPQLEEEEEADPLGAEGTLDSPGASSPRSSARSTRSSSSGGRRREAQEAADEAALGVPSSYDPARAEAAMQVLKVLGTKMKSHLVLMEYLARVSRAFDELQQADWARLTEECVVPQLRSFRQRLALFLRTDPRLSKMQAAQSLVGRGLQPGGGQALADVCRGAISCLASDAWAGGAPGLNAGPGVLLAEWLPPAFALTASGQRAIVALSGLTSADLEWILQGPQVTTDVRALLGPQADLAEENPREGAGFSAAAVRRRLHQSRGLPYGLLSDLRDAVPQLALPPPRPPLAPSAAQSLPALPRLGSKVWSSNLHSRQSSGRLKRKNSLSQLQLVAALPALLSRDIEL